MKYLGPTYVWIAEFTLCVLVVFCCSLIAGVVDFKLHMDGKKVDAVEN